MDELLLMTMHKSKNHGVFTKHEKEDRKVEDYSFHKCG